MKRNIINTPYSYLPTHTCLLACECGRQVRNRGGVRRMHLVLFIRHGATTKDDNQSTKGSAEVLQANVKFGLNLHFNFLSL